MRALSTLFVLLTLAGCPSANPVFVCPVGEAGWNEGRLAVEVVEVAPEVGGKRLVAVVRDAEHSGALVGVNALVVGTERGAATDAEGRLVLDGLGPDQRIQFSYVGYARYVLGVGELAGAAR